MIREGGPWIPAAVVSAVMSLGRLIASVGFLLAVSGSANFDGSLNISLVNDFMPQLGDMFVISTYNSHAGTFATVNAPALAGGLVFRPTYGPTSLMLTVVGP